MMESRDRSEELDLYRVAVDEYRFQAQFNWSRTQYWLVFNTAILAAGIALLGSLERGIYSSVVFAVGAVAAALSARAVRVTHDYYRAARNRVRRFEETLALPSDLRFDTTAGLQGRASKTLNVTAVSYWLLGVVAAADVVGAVAAVLQ